MWGVGLALTHLCVSDPFRVRVRVTYVLSGAGLSVTVRATNAMSHSAAPFQAGCHPYFHLRNSDFRTAKLVLDRACCGWNRQLVTPDTQVCEP
jgi:galactose mutarotase-like enzyme